MKKNFILGVFLIGLFVISFVSAGWFGDLFNRGATGNVVSNKGILIDKQVLSNGMNLSKGSNYYFIWDGEDASMSEVTSSLEGKISYIQESSSARNGKKNLYWYGDGNSKNKLEKFSKGEKYRIVLKENALWELKISKYAGIKENFGDIVYLSENELDTCFSDKACQITGKITNYEVLKEFLNGKDNITTTGRVGDISVTISEKEGSYSSAQNVLTQTVSHYILSQDTQFNFEKEQFEKKGRFYFIETSEEEDDKLAFAGWETKNELVVFIKIDMNYNTRNIEGIEDLLDAYLEKYPSNLPEDSPSQIIENPNQEEASNLTNTVIGEYVDFTSCEFKLETTSGISCDYDQVIGAVTHQDCADLTHPRIVGTAWSGNRIPSYFDYQCKDGSTPTIAYYCCDVKGVPNTGSNTRSASNEHSSRLDSEGKIVLY